MHCQAGPARCLSCRSASSAFSEDDSQQTPFVLAFTIDKIRVVGEVRDST